MGEISSELITFRDSVKPNIGSMNSVCSSIKNGIQGLSKSAASTKSSINSNYNSQYKSTIISTFDEVSSIYSQIAASLDEASSMISEAGAVASLVDGLEEINKVIAEQQRIINSNKGTTDAEKSRRYNANRILTEKNQEFETKHSEAKSKLSALKGKDGSLSFDGGAASAELSDTTSFEYGKVVEIDFVSKEGVKLHTYVYVPKGAENSVTKLPAMLYMHGDSTNNGDYTQAIKQGLPKMIMNKEASPSGIVIMPFIPSTGSFDDAKTQRALIELTDTVVEKYNGDKNRISVSGHSHGGMTAYTLVNQNPDYFSCVVPISGSARVSDAFKNVKVWSFNSVNEGNSMGGVTYNSGVNAVNKVNEVGGNATLTQLRKRHRYTNDETYEKKYVSPDGIEEYVYEWAFRQKKA